MDLLQQMIMIVHESEQRFDDQREWDFYQHVKPTVESYWTKAEQWKQQFYSTLTKAKQHQFDTTIDNLEKFIFHSFYRDVKKQRFLAMRQSILFVLNEWEVAETTPERN